MSKNRILIVEDEAVLRRIVADVMERAGYCVMVAEDGVSGLQLFKEFRPHLVIADVMLPRLDGFEMVKQMRSVDGVAQIAAPVLSGDHAAIIINNAVFFAAGGFNISIGSAHNS